MAGIIPGLLLASMFIIYIVSVAILRPEMVGEGAAHIDEVHVDDGLDTVKAELPIGQFFVSMVGVGGIVSAVLGGIWWGVFTPTEGAGAGAALALILALIKGMRWRGFVDAIYSVGKTAAPILILLLLAALYSRTLAMTGVTSAIRSFFVESGLQPWQVLAIIVLIWFVLGMIIDSISIMLLTVPIVEPVALAFGFDQLSFAIVGIIAIEAGLLTPPFGLLVYTVKAAIQDDEVGVQRIFMSAVPYWGLMLIAVLLIVVFPQIANLLPDVLM